MTVTILPGDCRDILRTLEPGTFDCVVTSPPYFGLRDYGVPGQIGLERTPDEYIEALVGVFRDVWRVLRDDGTLWLNLGDGYAHDRKWGGATGGKHARGLHGSSGVRARRVTDAKPKDLLMMPARVALALRADGWYLRSDIIWAKPNPMPESVTDRPTSAHEHIFLLSKKETYYYDADAIREDAQWGIEEGNGVNGGRLDRIHPILKDRGRTRTRKRGVPPHQAQYPSSDRASLDGVPRGLGRNRRNVWTVATKPFPDAHFATFPPDLIEPCILAGSRPGGTVLDPFGGAGTTGLTADRLGRHAVLIELNADYAELARIRINSDLPLMGGASIPADPEAHRQLDLLAEARDGHG